MTLVLNGTTGVSSVDGSASTPAIQGTDSNTGVFFPAADTVAIATGGSERLRADSSGNVGIGTSSPGSKLQVSGIISSVGSGTSIFAAGEIGTYTLTGVTSPNYGIAYGTLTGRPNPALTVSGFDAIAFGTNQTERARIDSSGNLLVGTTSTFGVGVTVLPSGQVFCSRSSDVSGVFDRRDSDGQAVHFRRQGNTVGSVSVTTTATAYNTSSDYRLKEEVQPMTGALAKVQALKPVTYKWKVDGSDGQGFIAHELQAIVPDCVTGEKDAVDAEGRPVYQGVDVSFLVATLTAAIQEQQAMIVALKAEVDALKGAQA